MHDEPGAVQFKYNTSYVALGGGLGLGGGGAAAAQPPARQQQRPQAVEPARLPPPLEELEEFISLEARAPQVGAGQEHGAA